MVSWGFSSLITLLNVPELRFANFGGVYPISNKLKTYSPIPETPLPKEYTWKIPTSLPPTLSLTNSPTDTPCFTGHLNCIIPLPASVNSFPAESSVEIINGIPSIASHVTVFGDDVVNST